MNENETKNIDVKLPEKVTVEYILQQIEAIRKDNEYIKQVVSDVGQLPAESVPQNCGDINLVSRAEALMEVVKCRETTNQQLIKFYTDIYNDMKPHRVDVQQLIADMIKNTLPGVQVDYESIIRLAKEL